MRSFSIYFLAALCLIFLCIAPTHAGIFGGSAACPGGICPLPVANPAAGPSCTVGQCDVPMIRLVPKVTFTVPLPTLAPRQVITPKPRIIEKTPRVHRPGRHGPRRVLQRLRNWRPLRGLLRCRR